jgi:hypothetical protein
MLHEHGHRHVRGYRKRQGTDTKMDMVIDIEMDANIDKDAHMDMHMDTDMYTDLKNGHGYRTRTWALTWTRTRTLGISLYIGLKTTNRYGACSGNADGKIEDNPYGTVTGNLLTFIDEIFKISAPVHYTWFAAGDNKAYFCIRTDPGCIEFKE